MTQAHVGFKSLKSSRNLINTPLRVGLSLVPLFSTFQRNSLSLHPLNPSLFKCQCSRKSHRAKDRGSTSLTTTSNLFFTKSKVFRNIQIIGKVFFIQISRFFFCLKMCFFFRCSNLDALWVKSMPLDLGIGNKVICNFLQLVSEP